MQWNDGGISVYMPIQYRFFHIRGHFTEKSIEHDQNNVCFSKGVQHVVANTESIEAQGFRNGDI